MVVAPASVAAVVTVAEAPGPSERAIGGWDGLTPGAPYASPLIASGGVVFQSAVATMLPRSTGLFSVAVTVGRFVISAAESDRRIRRLALVKSRSLNSTGLVTFSAVAGHG